MRRIFALAPLLLGIWLGGEAPLEAQNKCFDCHLAQQRDEDSNHLEAWQDSAHARGGVGCQDCHGGDASTLVQVQAHRGVRHSFSKKAPTHWRNLPATCGSCHKRLYGSLLESEHWQLFEQGQRRAPTCATCHGPLAVVGLGPGGLDAECSSCHAEGKSAEGVQIAGVDYLGRIRAVTTQRERMGRRVRQLENASLRHNAADAFFDGSQAWEEGLEAGHAFELDAMLELLSAAESTFLELEAALDEAEGAARNDDAPR